MHTFSMLLQKREQVLGHGACLLATKRGEGLTAESHATSACIHVLV